MNHADRQLFLFIFSLLFQALRKNIKTNAIAHHCNCSSQNGTVRVRPLMLQLSCQGLEVEELAAPRTESGSSQVHLVPKHWEAPLSFSPSPILPPLMFLVPGDAFDPNPKKIDVDMLVAGNNWGLALGWSREHLDTCDSRRGSVSSNSIPITMYSSNFPWPPGKEGHWSPGLPCRSSLLLCCYIFPKKRGRKGGGLIWALILPLLCWK